MVSFFFFLFLYVTTYSTWLKVSKPHSLGAKSSKQVHFLLIEPSQILLKPNPLKPYSSSYNNNFTYTLMVPSSFNEDYISFTNVDIS